MINILQILDKVLRTESQLRINNMVILIKLKNTSSDFGYGVGVIAFSEIHAPDAISYFHAAQDLLDDTVRWEITDNRPQLDTEARKKWLLSELEKMECSNE